MEKNTVLAIVLSITIMLVWFKWFQPPPPVMVQQPAAGIEEVQDATRETESVIDDPVNSRKRKKTKKGSKEQRITVQTADSIIELTSRGGAIEHWYINENQKEKENMPDLVFIGEPELLPLQVNIKNIGDLSDELFTIKGKSGQNETIVLSRGETAAVRFDYTTVSGVQISKIYDFAYEGGVHNFKLKVLNRQKDVVELKKPGVMWSSGLGIAGTGCTDKEKKICDSLNKENSTFMKVRSFVDGRLRKKLKDDIISPAIGWTGITNRYFVSALINKDNDFSRIIIDKFKPGARGRAIAQVGLGAESFSLQPGESKTFNLDLFVGLRDTEKMKTLGINLEEIINYGLFDPISKLFLMLLKFFHGLTNNYGVAIIMLTLVLHLITFPLSKKSLDSTRKMKTIQPHMKELQAKYKQDPKRLNVEMMNLYKTKKVNPFGGCLPMVFQIPIFWSLFSMLRTSIELRYEGFLWVADLSMKDPIYIFPILMGVAMFFQQKLTSPGMGDSSQQKMMMFMPVFFTFIFLKFPAGLTLYWLTNNILTLTQHFIMGMKDKKKNDLVVP